MITIKLPLIRHSQSYKIISLNKALLYQLLIKEI